MRIVFDCSSRESKSSVSLNDCLESGPPLLNDLCSIMIRFRLFKFGITADIEKAFLQLSIRPSCRDATRFFWLSNPNDPDSELIVSRFKRVLFGATCSPFLLNSSIIFHLRNIDFPLSQQLLRDIYVDNVVTSVHSEFEAVKFLHDSRNCFSEDNFNLRCWSSNSPELQKSAAKQETLEKCSVGKVFGLYWHIESDSMSFVTKDMSSDSELTKRIILQKAASIHDPLGLLLPVTIRSRILLQSIWKQNYDWDDPLSHEICKMWYCIINDIHESLDTRFSRIMNSCITEYPIELHVFFDSSTLAYGAVVYLVCKDESSLVIAKARVAPVKEITVPKLELGRIDRRTIGKSCIELDFYGY
ncbi:uncharacterized protein LOC141898937 [Tubulanus polymorphus]|uniref:uncharacterized protein LOC141898937 n=1 Tax=Tubulanus polymorphus TaxID=672921 RepID=UPI003DA2372F